MNAPATLPAPGGRRQRGAALLIGMIMVFMVSILGVSVMRGSTLEHRMATNAVQANEVTQAAESATEFGLNRTANLSDAFTAKDAEKPEERTLVLDVPAGLDEEGEDASAGHEAAIASEVQMAYVGAGLAPGYSAETFVGLRFIAQGRSSVGATGASSVIEQGAERVVPGN